MHVDKSALSKDAFNLQHHASDHQLRTQTTSDLSVTGLTSVIKDDICSIVIRADCYVILEVDRLYNCSQKVML